MRSLLLTLALACLAAGAQAQRPLRLVTTFQNNNLGAMGGVVYFDLIATEGASLPGIGLHISQQRGLTGSVDVHLIRGASYAGNETNASAWSLATTGTTASTQAIGRPTEFVFTSPILLNPGERTACALVLSPMLGHAYTVGNTSNQTASAPGIEFEGGSATNTAFSGPVFQPRIVNMSLSYVPNLVVAPGQLAVSERTPGTGRLFEGDGVVSPGEFLRYKLDDPLLDFINQPYAIFLNAGARNANPTATTSFLPGFVQRWTGSTPSASTDFVLPGVGSLTESVVRVPPGVFAPGDLIRAQTIVLDPTLTSAPLPVRASSNATTHEVIPPTFVREGFETGLPAGWTNSGTIDWILQTGETQSSATGPAAAFDGDTYLVAESSFPAAAGDRWVLQTPQFSASTQAATELRFQLSRRGGQIGRFEVFLDDQASGSATSVLHLSGPSPTGLDWDEVILTLPAQLPSSYGFRFVYEYGSGFNGDVGLDQVILR